MAGVPKKYTKEELRKRRLKQHYESMVRCGHATHCSFCGKFTKRNSGVCKACEIKERRYK